MQKNISWEDHFGFPDWPTGWVTDSSSLFWFASPGFSWTQLPWFIWTNSCRSSWMRSTLPIISLRFISLPSILASVGLVWEVIYLINKFFDLLSSLSAISNSNRHDFIQAMYVYLQDNKPFFIPSMVHFQLKRLTEITITTVV